MYLQEKEVVAYIGIGSNIGNRQENLEKSIEEMKKMRSTCVNKTSSFYDTEPVGFVDQDRFLNAVVEIHTSLFPRELLNNLQQIEILLKRKKTRHWGPRTIDLDILFYGNHKIQEKDLVIPHERLTERAFVLAPMAEIAPSFVNPATGQKISWHLGELRIENEEEGVSP